MAFNTGNPIGSTDARDLYDNAQNFDKAVNQMTPRWTDRFGVSRRSWAGMVAYVDLGDYAADLLITGYNEIFRHEGEFYRAGVATVLPYTTSGSWSEDGPYFVPIGDAALRQDIVETADMTIGYYRNAVNCNQFGGLEAALADSDTLGKIIVVTDAQVLTANISTEGRALVVEYGGIITTTGYTLTINSPFSAGAYQVFAGTGTVTGLKEASPEWWGAVGGDSTDDSAAFTAALTCVAASGGGVVRAQAKTYRVRNISVPTRVDLIGAQKEDTILQFHPSGDNAADSLLYTVNSAGAYSTISNLTISGNNAVGNGLSITPDANGLRRKIHNIVVRNFGGYNASPVGGTYGVAKNYARADISNGAGGHLLVGGNGIRIIENSFASWQLEMSDITVSAFDGDGIYMGAASDSKISNIFVGRGVNRGFVMDKSNKNNQLSNIKVHLCRVLNNMEPNPDNIDSVIPHEASFSADSAAVILTGSHIQATNFEVQECGSHGMQLGTSTRCLVNSNLDLIIDGNGGYDETVDATTQLAYKRIGLLLNNYYLLNLNIVADDFRTKHNKPRQLRAISVGTPPTFTSMTNVKIAEWYRIKANTGSDFTPLQLGLATTSNDVGFVFEARQDYPTALAPATFGTGSLAGVNDRADIKAVIINQYEKDQGTGAGYTFANDGGNSRIYINGRDYFKTTTLTTTGDYSKTDGTPGTVTGNLLFSPLSTSVVAGNRYRFVVRLDVTADVTGGHRYQMAGSCTASDIDFTINSLSGNATNVLSARQTALASSSSQAGATTVYTEIRGTITVATSGTLSVQFAQKTASGTSTVLTGSTLEITQIPN